VGLKSEFLDRAALLDLSVFYVNWNDIQLGTSFDDGSFGLANGGEATSQGIELTSSYSPLAGLRLGYSAAYTQSELTTVSPGASIATWVSTPRYTQVEHDAHHQL
jgi:outer membrane receptor protein involved in Fe transport